MALVLAAAETGHFVMSTLHTNDAPTTLTRMMNMGIAPFNIASSVIMITAQRLARKLCPACKKPEDIPPEALHNPDNKAVVPPLHGALLKNEQDVHLFERLVFMSRNHR